jgi:hypothetical protein
MNAIDLAKMQICQNQLLISMANTLSEIVAFSSEENGSAVALHMLEAADNLARINRLLIEKVRQMEKETPSKIVQ